jgi:glyoxylase-like metal-dependent hydrolase (beta-lactamase superfamily II)
MNRFLCVVGGVLLAAGTAAAQDEDFSKVEIKSAHVRGSVWMLQGAGGNIGVSVGDDGLLIVDDEYAPLSDKIKASLGEIGAGKKLEFVVNTHWHGDHTGGNAAFGVGATIVAQNNVRKRLSTKQVRPWGTTEPSPKAAWPVVTYENGVTLWFNGEEIEIFHVGPGHTDGDSVVIFKTSNVVHTGDQFFNPMFPFVDTDSGGDLAGYIKNVADIIAKIPPGAAIIPGHGSVANLDDYKKFHAALVKSVDSVRASLAKGLSLEDAKKAGLPQDVEPYAQGYLKAGDWIETVYKALKK